MGILAGVDWEQGVEEGAQLAGVMTATICDEIFTLNTSTDFQPKQW